MGPITLPICNRYIGKTIAIKAIIFLNGIVSLEQLRSVEPRLFALALFIKNLSKSNKHYMIEKISLSNIVEFRRRSDKSRSTYINSLKRTKIDPSESGGDYWIISSSAIG